ncbi:MAG: VWA domain-containing protein [Planctomycetaceae bacterium]|nr:VWA domain-containing protein [Planctomycetaceae bacterium]
MNYFASLPTSLILAADETTAFRSIEYDTPASGWGWLLLLGGLGLVLVLSFRTVWKDSVELSLFWRCWLAVLRLGVIIALIAIVFNPHERTQKMSFRPSRVAVLVDTSLSMRHPNQLVAANASSPASRNVVSRMEAVEKLLADSPLIKDLQKNHQVSIYSFDKTLVGPLHVFQKQDSSEETSKSASEKQSSGTEQPDWNTLLQPQGLETRLGELLGQLIREINGSTLSGIIIATDGASNAGTDLLSANEAAKESKVRLIPLGVGSPVQPANIQISKIIAPTDVQFGDGFEITAIVQAVGMPGKNITIELLRKVPGESEPTVVDTRDVLLPTEDSLPLDIKFERTPAEEGEIGYIVRARGNQLASDANAMDNELAHSVNVFSRPTRVLVIAGGPMRDYRFARTMLYRHPSIQSSVWLQSAPPGVSQDANELLYEFPDRADLFEYDVVLAFDVNWELLSAEQMQNLNEWVSSAGGGIVMVAGDVYTPRMAQESEKYQSILDLYPVFINSFVRDYLDEEATQIRRIEWTQAGLDAGFLMLTDDPATSKQLWENFPGIYRCYPSNGPKAAATVYAHFPDPKTQTEFGFSILMASQYYGEGRCFYLGSPEMWRLRSIEEDYYDRFWTKLIRNVGQGRTKRGTKRGTLILERDEYVLGQTVSVRVRLLDPEFKPLIQESVPMEVIDPRGRPLVPNLLLMQDRNRPGEYVASFRAGLPGKYQFKVTVPNSKGQMVEGNLTVLLPRLEDESLSQNVKGLKELARDTGGRYLALEEAEQIPALLPDQGEEFLVDERLKTLWDQGWVFFLLAGLLAAEWLTRKLFKLA